MNMEGNPNNEPSTPIQPGKYTQMLMDKFPGNPEKYKNKTGEELCNAVVSYLEDMAEMWFLLMDGIKKNEEKLENEMKARKMAEEAFWQLCQTSNQLRAEAAELKNTVSALTLEKKELLLSAEKSKAEACALAVEAYKASKTGFHQDASEFSIQVCKGFWDDFIKEVLRVHPDLDLSGVVNPLDAITAVHSLLLLGRD